MKTKRTFSLSQKGKVLAFCLGEKTKAFMPTSFLARAAMTLLVMVLTTTTSIAMTSSVDWSGSGSEDDPYIISNTDQLDLLAQRVNAGVDAVVNGFSGKYFKLGANIAYNKETANNFTPIGDNSHIFYGTFDGDGKTISGININSGVAEYQAIFGTVSGTVKNLVVSNCSIVASHNIGAIAGFLYGTIENCHVDNVTLSGNSYAGGIVGYCGGGTIKGCTCAATITGIKYGGWNAKSLGGIVGATTEFASTSSKLTDNIFTGTISGDLDYNIGAIVGENASGTLLTNNVYTSTVLGGIGKPSSTTGADGAGAKHVYTIAAGEKLTVDFAGDATTTYSPNGISVYGAGMKYANTLYVDGTAAVSVKLSSDDPVNSYSASAGTLTGTAITGSEDAYTLAMATPASDITITADFALWGEKDGADGSAEKPYIITTTAGLDKLAQRVNAGDDAVVNGFSGKFFKLGDNIAYNKETADNFTPIGDIDHIFYGTFDGDGKTISGININSGSAEYQAIFGFVNGTVKNLVVSNCSIVGRRMTGAIAGTLRSGTIENCHVDNVTLSGNSYAGGIVGSCERGTIKGCTCAATITGRESSGMNAKYLGGIVGATNTSYLSTLTDNIFTGTITGDLGEYIGAIVGMNIVDENNNNNVTLTNNLYTSTVLGGIGAEGSTTGADDAGARKALTISAASDVTITPKGTATTYNVSGITVYADNSGMGYASKFYAGATNAVKLTLDYSGTPSGGYTFAGYAASNGGTISGNATDGYTLTMPAKDATVTAILWSGDGSADHPYIISNTDQLDVLAQRVNAGGDAVVNGFSGKFFKLGDNIAYNKETANNFTPIGDNSHIFYGTFDGDGKTISGININSGSADCQAIFGDVAGTGTVKNLVVSNCSIVGLQFIGAIAGILHGTIENCHVDNVTLSGYSYAGGIVGSCGGGTIKGCTSAATITGIKFSDNNAIYLGGIVGGTYEYNSTSSKLTDNIFTGTITGNLTEYIGAIVGKNASGTLLTNNLYTSTGFGGIGSEGADGAGARQALTISAATGVTITPTGTATTYKTSGITSYADNKVIGYDSKFYAGATEAAKLTIAYTVPEGYTFGGYAASNGGTISGNATDGYTLTMPAANVTVTPTLTPIEYTLQYNGADGATFATANPTTYTVESDAITLTNPTKDGYTFAGWTGTDITDATTTVTIAKGSTGNREYTATWSLADYTITYDLAGGTLAEGVSNPTGYNIDSDDITLNNPTREGYTFAGWTGTGLTEATTTVTIAKGSHENKTFTATWEKNPDTRYVVDADGVAVTTMAYLAELALDDTMQDYVEKGKLKATVTPKNKYWTLACGVDLLLPEGVKVYKARMNSAGTKVELTEIDAATLGGVLKANNGVLIEGTPGQSYDLVVSPNNSVTTLSNADAKSYGTDNELEPVLEDTHFTTDDYFILMENKFIMVDISKDTKVPAGKAVLKVAAGSAKTRTLDVIDGETTGISSAVNSADDEVWYNLQGQRISKPTRKGVYILNGKKVRR